MHILLTGEIGIGKSTALRKFLAQTGLTADGFRTFFIENGDEWLLQLERFDTEIAETDRERQCAALITDENPPVIYADVFANFGADMLESSGKRELIVMDELGIFEENAPAFTSAVLQILDGEKTVVGVVKAKQSAFPDAVRAHPNVTVLTVTLENRDEIPREMMRLLDIRF